MPLLNDHNLDIEDIRSQGLRRLPVWMQPSGPSHRVTTEPTSTKGSRYTELVRTWRFENPTGGGLGNVGNPDDDDDALAGTLWDDLDNSADDWSRLMSENYDSDDADTEKCELCAKLGVQYAERLPIRLAVHRRKRHGTDPDGNILNGRGANN